MTIPPYQGPSDQEPPQGYQAPGSQGAGQPGYPPAGGQQPPPSGYPPQQPAYGPGYGQPKQDEKALWALILSILGWIACPIVLHIVGWILAQQSIRAIEESNGWLTGDGMARAARIISIIGLVVYGLGLVLVVLLAVFGAIASVGFGSS